MYIHYICVLYTIFNVVYIYDIYIHIQYLYDIYIHIHHMYVLYGATCQFSEYYAFVNP